MASAGEMLLPPLLALLIYLGVVYLWLPVYRQRQRYAQYMPISLPSGTIPENLLGTWRDRLFKLLSPGIQARLRERRYSGLSDEELDPVDGLDALHEHYSEEGAVEDNDGDEASGEGRESREEEEGRRGRGGRSGFSVQRDEQNRLSRDLEAGFMDDSDEEEERGRARR